MLSSPDALKRQLKDSSSKTPINYKETVFTFGNLNASLFIELNTTIIENLGDKEIDLIKNSEEKIKVFESKGLKNIFVKREKYTTPNGAEGLKTFGAVSIPYQKNNIQFSGEFVYLNFTTENILQQVLITWDRDDIYAVQIVERLIKTLELKKAE